MPQEFEGLLCVISVCVVIYMFFEVLYGGGG